MYSINNIKKKFKKNKIDGIELVNLDGFILSNKGLKINNQVIRNIKVIKPENDNEKAINLSSSNSVITAICEKTNIPYNNFYLSTDTINKIINYKMTRPH